MGMFLIILGTILLVLSVSAGPFIFWLGLMLIVISFLKRRFRLALPTSPVIELDNGRRVRICSDTHCRHVNEPHARFCARCGQLLD